jgi:hypothetical protein
MILNTSTMARKDVKLFKLDDDDDVSVQIEIAENIR